MQATYYSRGWVSEQVAETTAVWQKCALRSDVPPGRQFVPEEQARREAAYDLALSQVEREVEQVSVEGARNIAAAEKRVLQAFAEFSANALHLESEAISVLKEQFIPIGLELAVWARRFDPKLSMSSIIQACRNAWTACGMQPLFGLPVELTPAILGYSLLYPYSDNYLDREDLAEKAKRRFSERFLWMLQGEAIAPLNHREAAIASLIRLIENQYPRQHYPQVFASLLAIHAAQENSIRQIAEGQSFDLAEVLRLSFAKGGTSVLADACLVSPDLSPAEMQFAFSWGVLLQLGDDLQDVQDDLKRGSLTAFSSAAKSGQPMDALAAQLLYFGEEVGRSMDALPHGNTSLKSLLKMSWRSLIVGAIAESAEFFTSNFLAQAEQASPFRFPFLRARRERLQGHHGLYAGMFELILRGRTAAGSVPTRASLQSASPSSAARR